MIMHEKDQETENEKPELIKLMEYWNADWANAEAEHELEEPRKMNEWSNKVLAQIPESSALTLLEALHMIESDEWLTERDLMYEALKDRIAGDIDERLTMLENGFKILLDHFGDTLTGVTLAKLIKLKGVKIE